MSQLSTGIQYRQYTHQHPEDFTTRSICTCLRKLSTLQGIFNPSAKNSVITSQHIAGLPPGQAKKPTARFLLKLACGIIRWECPEFSRHLVSDVTTTVDFRCSTSEVTQCDSTARYNILNMEIQQKEVQEQVAVICWTGLHSSTSRRSSLDLIKFGSIVFLAQRTIQQNRTLGWDESWRYSCRELP